MESSSFGNAPLEQESASNLACLSSEHVSRMEAAEINASEANHLGSFLRSQLPALNTEHVAITLRKQKACQERLPSTMRQQWMPTLLQVEHLYMLHYLYILYYYYLRDFLLY